MCHINLVFKKDRKNDKKLSRYMNIVSFFSYKQNDDSEGYVGFSGDDMVWDRSLNKFRFSGNYWFLATHQRTATSGRGVINAHPHETDDLLIMHNGIFSGLGNDNESDTKMFCMKLQEAYVKADKNITKAVRELMKDVEGSYSVIVIEKATADVFYFKNRSTYMYKVEDKDFLIMSTSEDNLKFAKWWFNMRGSVKDVDEERVYNVLNNLKSLGKFEPKAITSSISGYGDSSCRGYDDYHYSGRSTYHSSSIGEAKDWLKDDRILIKIEQIAEAARAEK